MSRLCSTNTHQSSRLVSRATGPHLTWKNGVVKLDAFFLFWLESLTQLSDLASGEALVMAGQKPKGGFGDRGPPNWLGRWMTHHPTDDRRGLERHEIGDHQTAHAVPGRINHWLFRTLRFVAGHYQPDCSDTLISLGFELLGCLIALSAPESLRT